MFANQLPDQFKSANLCALNNNWSNVYDFTVNDEEIHWNIFSNVSLNYPNIKPDYKLSEKKPEYKSRVLFKIQMSFHNIIFFQLKKKTAKAEDYFSGIPSEETIGLTFNSNTSIVPKTLGSLPTAIGVGELVLILIISGEQSHTTAITVIREMEKESEVK